MTSPMDWKNAIRSSGAAACGVVSRGALLPWMREDARLRLEADVPDWQSVLVAAYPYYVRADAPSPALSRYAWGTDYHAVLTQAMMPVAEQFRAAGHHAEIFADVSPIPERIAAALAGLGVLGKNGLLLLPDYGSYCFIGCIVTTAVLPANDAPIRSCEACGACIRACPTGALSADGYDVNRCLSHISQKKGELSMAEAALLRENRCLWGCDVCQSACPHNEHSRETAIPAFREQLVKTLTADDLAHHTNRSFREAYGDRAFAWRGPAVLRRNLAILSEPQIEDKGE